MVNSKNYTCQCWTQPNVCNALWSVLCCEVQSQKRVEFGIRVAWHRWCIC